MLPDRDRAAVWQPPDCKTCCLGARCELPPPVHWPRFVWLGSRSPLHRSVAPPIPRRHKNLAPAPSRQGPACGFAALPPNRLARAWKGPSRSHRAKFHGPAPPLAGHLRLQLPLPCPLPPSATRAIPAGPLRDHPPIARQFWSWRVLLPSSFTIKPIRISDNDGIARFFLTKNRTTF